MKINTVILFISLLASISTASSAQVTFQKLYPTGAYQNPSMIQVSDSSFALTGGITATTFITLVKINKDGSIRTTIKYEPDTSAVHNNGTKIVQTTDGYAILTDNGEIIRTDTAGNILWTKKYGTNSGDVQSNLIQTTDGGFLFVNVGSNKLIIKTDAAGDTLWTKYYWRQQFGVLLYHVEQTADHGYIFGGSTSSNSNDCYLLKTDSSGNAEWARTYGGAGNERFYCVIQNADGGFTACGYSWSFTGPTGGTYVVRTDAAGDTLWSKFYYMPYSNYFTGCSVNKCSDGGFIIGGMEDDTGTIISRPCMLKTDSMGNLTWAKFYGRSIKDYNVTAIQTLEGGFLCFVGEIDSTNHWLYAIKTDSLGNSYCTESIPVIVTMDPPTVVAIPDTFVQHHLLQVADINPFAASNDTSEINLCMPDYIPANAHTPELKLSPDPFTDAFTISFNAKTGALYHILITDITGRILMSKNVTAIEGNNKEEIQIGNLAEDIYFVTIQGEGGIVSAKALKAQK